MLLHDLFKDAPALRLRRPLPPSPVKGVSHDSRCVDRGYLFIAIRGTRHDGHRFIPEAIKRGASCLLVDRAYRAPEYVRNTPILLIRSSNIRRASSFLADRWYGSPSRSLDVYGVTGTNGKTTTADIIQTLMSGMGVCGSLNTVKTSMGTTSRPSTMTTPDSWLIHRSLREMADRGSRACSVEVSSHALDQDRVRDIRFRRCVFTNLSQDHLDYHGTLKQYARTKRKLFFEHAHSAMPVINADDAFGRIMIKDLRGHVKTYGFGESADYRASGLVTAGRASRFRFTTPSFSVTVNCPLLGPHNIYNFLAAAALALEEGMSKSLLLRQAALIAPVAGRLERIDEGQPFDIFVDYAHTPDAMERVLSYMRSVSKGGLGVVFGCGGDRDKGKRAVMGRMAAQYADRVYVTSDNPRSELPEAILRDIRRGRPRRHTCAWQEIVERRKAIEAALTSARTGDTILVLGKGHEVGQWIGSNCIPFHDPTVIRDCLKEHAVVFDG